MSDETRQLLQLFIEDTYDDFISDVAVARGLQKDAVDAIGQGQIWTGTEALQNGLVDGIGGLRTAVELAGELAELEPGKFGTIMIEQELTPSEQLIVDLLSITARAGVDLSRWAPTPDIVSRLKQVLNQRLDAVLRFNDPRGLYQHCLCDLD